MQFCGFLPSPPSFPLGLSHFSPGKPVLLNKSGLDSKAYWPCWEGSGGARGGVGQPWCSPRGAQHQLHIPLCCTTAAEGGTAWGQEGKGLPSASSAGATKPGKTSGLHRFERKNFYIRIQIGKHISLQALENECHPPNILCPPYILCP